MFYAILEGKVIDVQEELQEYGPDVFGNPVRVVESDIEDIPLGTVYDFENQEFVIQSIEQSFGSGSTDDIEENSESYEKTLDDMLEMDYNNSGTNEEV